jgi:hypothetical protein
MLSTPKLIPSPSPTEVPFSRSDETGGVENYKAAVALIFRWLMTSVDLLINCDRTFNCVDQR